MKLGIVGLCRGLNFVKSAKLNGVDVVAICDWDPKRIETALTTCPPGTATYSNFDEFIKHDMDAVVIANYFMPSRLWKTARTFFANVPPLSPWANV